MKKTLLLLFTIFTISILYYQCAPEDTTGVNVKIDKPPFETLSEYRFFAGDLANLEPNEGVLPYDLNTPLFTDYAKKARFVWMPDGKSATYRTGEVLDFPEGAVLIKNFYYENDERNAEAGKNIIETRLLIHRKKGWEAHSYVWNKEQTEANLDLVGDIRDVNWTNAAGEKVQAKYIIPNKNQCKGCHSYKGKIMPIGPKVRNLNKTYAYADGEANQLEKMNTVGYLAGFEASQEHPKVPVWDDEKTGSLHDRALAYLDINCGHCHNPNGPGGTTGLNLVYGNALDINLGVNKAPVATGRASGGHSYSIVKGHPEKSIMTHRMESTEPGVMMPELGRTSQHKEGLALITQWIKEM